MFKKFTNGCVSLVQRFLPDPFIFCIVLTFIVMIAAFPATGQNPFQMVLHWGSGVWSLLGFSMQMVLVLVLGTAFANAPAVQKGIGALASIPKTSTQAIVATVILSTVCSWLNWGFGLIAGVLYAKEIARRIKNVDYRLLVAASYVGFVVWHAGLSGSIPLAMAEYNEALVKVTGGAVETANDIAPITTTIFSVYNLVICGLILVILPIVFAAMQPPKGEEVTVDPALLMDEDTDFEMEATTPAEKMENSMILSIFIGIMGLVFIVNHFITKGFKLDLNIVNMIFLIVGILLHKTPINYVRAIVAATRGSAGIILQFPFYAGIMGMMTGANADGVSLASVISNFFVSISTDKTFPMFSFWSAGIVNFFVPSGGGQWSVQGPIMMPAAKALGVDLGVASMAVAWGDAWTNLLQPFWALPALGVAKLGARDIMGYCVIGLIVSGVIITLGFLLLA